MLNFVTVAKFFISGAFLSMPYSYRDVLFDIEISGEHKVNSHLGYCSQRLENRCAERLHSKHRGHSDSQLCKYSSGGAIHEVNSQLIGQNDAQLKLALVLAQHSKDHFANMC
jgi:hypothetical protein